MTKAPSASKAKPPTQIAGVVGIEAKAITMNLPAQSPAIDWARLVELPPFQMWAAQRAPAVPGRNSQEHAIDVVAQHGQGLYLFEEYAAWHAAKSYWPNETPLGELKAQAR